MKRLIFIFCIIIGSFASSYAGPWDDYSAYRIKASAAFDARDVAAMNQWTVMCVTPLQMVNRLDLLAWRLNNYAYLLILDFQDKVGYEERMDIINAASAGKDKDKYIRETKKLFRQYRDNLDQAKKALEDAKKMDEECPARYKDEQRTTYITNNLDAVNGLLDYIKGGPNEI